jgi:hypothetical protein
VLMLKVLFVDCNCTCLSPAFGPLNNFPQVCSAGSRLLVQAPVFDRLIKKIKARMATLRLGDSLDKNIDMGAIVDESQVGSYPRFHGILYVQLRCVQLRRVYVNTQAHALHSIRTAQVCGRVCAARSLRGLRGLSGLRHHPRSRHLLPAHPDHQR